MRDAAGLAPPLAWLAVWNRHIQSDINEKRETAGEEDDAAVEHDGDDDNEQEPERDRSGVLYGRIYSPVEEGQERDLLARRVGLAQGLIDFTSSFAKKKPSTSQDDDQGEDTSENTDTSKQIRVVNSQNHRLVFLQPEANYWIVASFDRYITPPSRTHSRETSSASNTSSSTKATQKKSQTQQARFHPSSFLPNEAFADLLRRAYAEFRLFNGTFSYILENQGLDFLRTSLKSFFDAWRGEARLIPLGIPIAPPLNIQDRRVPDFPPGYTAVAISHAGVLEISSPSLPSKSCYPESELLTPTDRLVIACHLANILPKPPPPIPSSSSGLSSKQKEKKIRKQASFSSSTWKSLNLGGIANYLPSMPSLPGSSASSKTSISNENATENMPSEPSKHPLAVKKLDNASALNKDSNTASTAHRTVSGSGWMPSFRLFSSTSSIQGNGKILKQPGTETGAAPTELSMTVDASTADGSTIPMLREIDKPSGSAASVASVEALSEAMVETISPEDKPLSVTSPDQPIESSENAEPSETRPVEAKAAKPEEPTPRDKLTWRAVQTVHIGKPRRPTSCLCINNDEIATAFISVHQGRAARSSDENMNDLEETDKIRLESYFRDLATIHSKAIADKKDATPLSSRKFLTFAPGAGSTECNGVQEQIIEDMASASTASFGQRFNLAINGKTDTDKLMKIGAKEAFIRTYFSQWLVAKSGEAATGEDPISRLTILPKSIGKEGSLVDADTEMRRLSEYRNYSITPC